MGTRRWMAACRMRRVNSAPAAVLLWTMTAAVLAACGPAEPPDLADRQVATVFATAGDPPSAVDVEAAVGQDGTVSLLNQPASAALSGSVVTLDNTNPVHQAVRLSVERDGRAAETLVIWHAVQPRTAPSWPLSVSPDGRHLVDSRGGSVVWTGGSPWGLTVVPGRDGARLYLADRAEKKVNAVLVRLIDHLFSDRNPAWLNHYGHAPFTQTLETGAPDFSTPGESYWRQVDWVIREAYRRGITVLGAPAYVGYKLDDQGWADHLLANGEARLRQYGAWLAERYRDYPNLVWVMGGDWSTEFEGKAVTAEVDAIADAIKSRGSDHLMTAHSHRNRSARDDYDRAWLDINSSYGGYGTIHERVRTDYQRTPPMPTFLIEGHYGNEHGMTERAVRTQMYHALLGGAFGQLYGNAPQWYFSADVADRFADRGGRDWKRHLDDFGARYLPIAAEMAEEFPLDDLRPDFEHRVMTSGFGPENEEYAPMAYADDLALAYLPGARAVTIDMSHFEDRVIGRWRSPVDGADTAIEAIPDDGPVSLSPPGPGDWILILETESRGNDGGVTGAVADPVPVARQETGR